MCGVINFIDMGTPMFFLEVIFNFFTQTTAYRNQVYLKELTNGGGYYGKKRT